MSIASLILQWSVFEIIVSLIQGHTRPMTSTVTDSGLLSINLYLNVKNLGFNFKSSNTKIDVFKTYVTSNNCFIIKQGGLKAVLWTDTLQIGIMFAGIFAVIINAFRISGAAQIWESARVSGRLDFIE